MIAGESADRRPLETRGWPFFRKLATDLAGLGVTPNAISLGGVLFALLAGGCLAATSRVEGEGARRVLWLAAAALVQLRLLSNLLDGLVAVEGGKGSPTGEIFNEVPDRIADLLILGGAGLAAGSSPLLGLGAALAAFFVAYVRAFGAGAGAGQVFLGPFAKPHRMFCLTVTCLLLTVLPSAWLPIHENSGWGLMAAVLCLLILGGLYTSWRRLSRIASSMRREAGESRS